MSIASWFLTNSQSYHTCKDQPTVFPSYLQDWIVQMCTNHIECAVLSCFFMYKLPTLPSLSKSLHPQQFHYSYLNSLITIVNNFLNVNHFFPHFFVCHSKSVKKIYKTVYKLIHLFPPHWILVSCSLLDFTHFIWFSIYFFFFS